MNFEQAMMAVARGHMVVMPPHPIRQKNGGEHVVGLARGSTVFFDYEDGGVEDFFKKDPAVTIKDQKILMVMMVNGQAAIDEQAVVFGVDMQSNEWKLYDQDEKQIELVNSVDQLIPESIRNWTGAPVEAINELCHDMVASGALDDKFTLPTWEECRELDNNHRELTALQKFVLLMEPSDFDAEKEFRDMLTAAINEVRNGN